MVSLEGFEDSEDVALVRSLIERHVRHTGSPRGRWVLDHFARLKRRFVKVMPNDYRCVLEEQATAEQEAAG